MCGGLSLFHACSDFGTSFANHAMASLRVRKFPSVRLFDRFIEAAGPALSCWHSVTRASW
jgi:hypothetical protein